MMRAAGRPVDISRAVAADADAVGRLQIGAWEQTYRGLVDDAFLAARDLDESIDRWSRRIATGSRDVHVARADGTVVGVASTAREETRADLPSLELCTLYLARSVQGSGLADRLLDHAIGVEASHLLVFRVNVRAQRFYARHGFSPVGPDLIDPGTGLRERRWVRR